MNTVTLKPTTVYNITISTDHIPPVTKSYQCAFIGKGRYSNVYRVVDSDVVLIRTHEHDYAKEILCNTSGVPHLPILDHIGDETSRIFGTGQTVLHNWYRTTYYDKLTAKHVTAWKDYKRLRLMLKSAYTMAYKHGSHFNAVDVNNAFMDLVANDEHLGANWERAITALVDWCATYGSSWLIEELQPRNCGVDSNGDLVLVDPILDWEVSEKQRSEQRQRRKRNVQYA